MSEKREEMTPKQAMYKAVCQHCQQVTIVKPATIRAVVEAERQCECGAAYAHASWMSYCPECGGSLPAIREGSDG